jgi:predicted TIM-barrel fold metal-dependent hydrolase
MAPVDEWRIASEPEAVIGQARAAIEVHGLHAIKVIPEYAYLLAGVESFDGPAWRPFWDAVTQLDVPIFFTLGAPPGSTDPRQGFLDELWTLARWADRYPNVEASVTHGFNWRHHVSGDRIELSDAMWEPFRDRPNLSIEVSFAVRIGDQFDYPWAVTRPVLEAMVANIGADRLLWGTDMPFQNRFCTYRQSRDAIERYSPFLDPGQMSALMGGTAARILRIPGA